MKSLRYKLLFAFLAVVVLVLVVVAFISNQVIGHGFNQYLERRFDRDQELIVRSLGRELKQKGADETYQLSLELAEQYGREIYLSDENGRLLYPTGTLETAPPKMFKIEMDSDLIIYIAPAKDQPKLPTGFELPFRGAESDRKPQSIEANLWQAINRALWMSAFVGMVLGGVISYFFSQRILQPVSALTEAVRQIEQGDWEQQVAIESDDEIGMLGQAFNSMAQSRAKLEQLRQRMVTDIAHELRTPLTNIRGYIEAIQDEVLPANEQTIGSIHEEVMLLNHLIEDLQELSLAEAGRLRLEMERSSLDQLLIGAVNGMQARSREKEVTLYIADSVSVEIDVDQMRLGQILRNLLSNALNHTDPGGEIKVSSSRASGNMISIIIEDSGIGIPTADLPYIFDRFHRADLARARSSGGSGLGLAIVKALVEGMNGQITVWSELDVGTRFSLYFPIVTDEL